MSKRRSESNFNSKEENFDESNSKHKRRKLNEEGDDGKFIFVCISLILIF